MSNRRNTNIDGVLFEVELQPIFAKLEKLPATTDARNLFGETPSTTSFQDVKQYRAVVDAQQQKVLSVVSRNYALVTNKEAIRMGEEIFKSVFSQTTVDGMVVYNITQPKTRAFCHIDYVNKGHDIEPFEGDKWAPFLRITNSYNRSRVLRFDFGFCRGFCSNGMILGHLGSTVSAAHTREAMHQMDRMPIANLELKSLEAQFIDRLTNLREFEVPDTAILPLTCKALDIKVSAEDGEKPRRVAQLLEFRNQISELTEKYFYEMGPNAYAGLNIITDFASRPDSFVAPHAVIDRLQKRSGEWLDEFVKEIKQGSFELSDYLQDFRETARIINSLN